MGNDLTVPTHIFGSPLPVSEDPPQIPSNNNKSGKRKERIARKVSDLTNDDTDEENNMIRLLDAQDALPESKLIKANSGIARPVFPAVGHTYAQMFVNSVNSGDLLNAQKFFRTFMATTGTFVANHRVGPRYGLPEILSAFSPQLFAHYLLGVFATFPDLVLKLGDTRTVSQGGKTRIEMDIQVMCTKLYDIPNYSWAPQAEELCSTFQTLAVSSGQYQVRPNRVIPEQRGPYAAPASGPANPGPRTAYGSYRYASTDGGATYGPVYNGPYGTASNGTYGGIYAGATAYNGAYVGTYNGPYAPSAGSNANDHSGPYGVAWRNRSCAIAKPTPTDITVLQRLPIAPSNFVTALVDQAEVLAVPIPLHTKGTITLYLDENNSIQHIAIDHHEQKKEPPLRGARAK